MRQLHRRALNVGIGDGVQQHVAIDEARAQSRHDPINLQLQAEPIGECSCNLDLEARRVRLAARMRQRVRIRAQRNHAARLYFGQCPPGRSLKIDLPKYDVGFEAFHTINTNAQAVDEGKWTPDSSPVAGNLYVIGCLKYRDEVGLRRTYFAYRWNWREGRFEAVEHPNYNYES